MVKIKTLIIFCCICLLVGILGTGLCGYIYIKKSMAKYEQLNIRYNIDKLEATKRIEELGRLNKQLENTIESIRQSGIAIQKSNKKSIEYCNEIDSRCRELQEIIRKVNCNK